MPLWYSGCPHTRLTPFAPPCLPHSDLLPLPQPTYPNRRTRPNRTHAHMHTLYVMLYDPQPQPTPTTTRTGFDKNRHGHSGQQIAASINPMPNAQPSYGMVGDVGSTSAPAAAQAGPSWMSRGGSGGGTSSSASAGAMRARSADSTARLKMPPSGTPDATSIHIQLYAILKMIGTPGAKIRHSRCRQSSICMQLTVINSALEMPMIGTAGAGCWSGQQSLSALLMRELRTGTAVLPVLYSCTDQCT